MNLELNLIDSQLEGVLIGTVLLGGNAAFEEASAIVRRDSFGVERHRQVWASIERIAADVEIGVDSVTHDLIERGKLESIGGFAEMMDLHALGLQGVPVSGFAQSIATKAKRRRELAILAAITKAVELGDPPNVLLLDELRALADGSAASRGAIAIERLPAVGESTDPIQYIREPELPEAAVVALTGDAGSGKSTIATAWCRDAIAEGRPVLVLDRENSRPGIIDRMRRLGLNDTCLLRWYGAWVGQEAPSPDAAVVAKWVESCDPKPLVIVDSLIAFFQGDENSSTEMRAFMHSARRLADLGATVVVIHHDGKSETARDFRGSSDFKASVDAAFHVSNISSDSRLDRMRLRCFKSRFGFTGDVVYYYADGQFSKDERSDAPARTTAGQLTSFLRMNPGVKSTDFEARSAALGVSRQQVREFLSDGVLGGLIRRETGSQNTKRYTLEVAE